MPVDPEQLRLYISDAAAHFDSPAEVLKHDQLGDEDKRRILESWKIDELELATATQENMGQEDSVVLSEVNAALRSLAES